MPKYVIDESRLRRNLEILRSVADRAGVKILLAQKAFSCARAYPLCSQYLAGTTASSLFEARHGRENFPGETHIFAPAYISEEIDEILGIADHIVFNSPKQVMRFAAKAKARGVSTGLRVNPEMSVATTPAYDPCRPTSRLGTTKSELEASPDILGLVDGLHFHCLCEQGLGELKKVLAAFEEKFGKEAANAKWVNFGGGHHITKADYDTDGLVELLKDYRSRHPGQEVYLEPGEAVALDAGFLVSKVLEIRHAGADGIANAILDTSAACHMPDVLEMPYTPRVSGAKTGAGGPFAYRFGAPTCLAGDEIGVYSFETPLEEGGEVTFEDMAIYTMVKNNTFNGVNLPDIVYLRENGAEETLRRFGYADFACRL